MQILCGDRNESFLEPLLLHPLKSVVDVYMLWLLTTSSVICIPLLFFGFLDLSLFHTASSASPLAVKDTSAPTLNQRKPTHRKHSSSTGIKNPGAPNISCYTILLFFVSVSLLALWLSLFFSIVTNVEIFITLPL